MYYPSTNLYIRTFKTHTLTRRLPCNAVVQYEPRTMSDSDAQSIMEGAEIAVFLQNICPRWSFFTLFESSSELFCTLFSVSVWGRLKLISRTRCEVPVSSSVYITPGWRCTCSRIRSWTCLWTTAEPSQMRTGLQGLTLAHTSRYCTYCTEQLLKYIIHLEISSLRFTVYILYMYNIHVHS